MDLGTDLDWVAEQLLYLSFEAEQVQTRVARVEVDQQVDVTSGFGIPPGTDPNTRM